MVDSACISFLKGTSRILALAAGFLVLLVDIISKYITEEHLPLIGTASRFYPYGGIGIFKDFLGVEFSLVHATNRGAAWGIFADFQYYLLILRIILISAVIAYFFFSNKHKNWRIPLALIIFGAIGNVIDYFLYGHVIDMFFFRFWTYDFAVFNVADSAVTIGICWLLILSFLEPVQNL